MLLSSVRANNNTPFLFSPASFPHPREIRAGHGEQDAKAGARRHPQPGGESVQGAGGPSTLALPTPAAPLPRPCLRRAHPGPPRLRGPPVPVLWRGAPSRAALRRAPLPTLLSHLRCVGKAPEKLPPRKARPLRLRSRLAHGDSFCPPRPYC